MSLRLAAVCSGLGLLVALGVRSSSGQEVKSKSDDFFTKQVRPILEANCFQCHSHGAKKADRKSTRLNSSHLGISYAVFCLKKKKHDQYKTDDHKGNYDDE